MKLMVMVGMSASFLMAEFGPRTEIPQELAGDRDCGRARRAALASVRSHSAL